MENETYRGLKDVMHVKTVFKLSQDDFDRFVDELDNPPKINAELVKLFSEDSVLEGARD